MRACAACFYCPPPTHDPEGDSGECWNRPPIIVSVPQPIDEEGKIRVELLSVRPTVSLGQFCAFFAYRSPKASAT